LSAAEDALKSTKAGRTPIFSLSAWKRNYRRLAVAAVTLIVISALAQWYFHHSKKEQAHEIIAERGSKTRTILPDGSTVWLNAGSVISYNPNFNGPYRELTLQGEAYFDIIKMPGRPFIVHAGDINIRVLGTAFNVKSYEDDKSVETTLIRGLVQITRTNDTKGAPIYLHPHQKIVLLKNNTDVAKVAPLADDKPADVAAAPVKIAKITYLDTTVKDNERVETAWMYNRLEFRGDSFEELSKKFVRWYNITIHFNDEAARHLKFNGSLENETVEQAFQALTAAASFNFKINNNDIFISSSEKPVP
jgi:transmembrane sensor